MVLIDRDDTAMARLPCADLRDPALQPLVAQIVEQRGEVLHLYRMLLHSPPVAEGWLQLLTAIRQQGTLPGRLRELVIIRIALLNAAPYEAQQHIPIALREGVTQAQIDGLIDWENQTAPFSQIECAVLALTDQMTRHVQVEDAVWQAVSGYWSDRELVELVATIASYNMVSRFLEALSIHPAPGERC